MCNTILRISKFFLLSFFVFFGALANAQGNAKKAAVPSRGKPITLNFANADIESVARAIASITGRNVVLDSRVKGNITLQSEQPISSVQAINQFAAALRMQGFSLIESKGLYKVMPEADAKLHAKVLPRGRIVAGNQVVTQVFRLKYQNANQILPVLRPLISPNNVINASNSSTLVITDYADNLQRVARIIATMDMPAGSEVQIIPLHYGIATDIAPLVQRLMFGAATAPLARGAQAGGGGGGMVNIVAEPRSNSIIIRAATQMQAVQAQSLILKLDKPSLTSNNRNGDAGNIWVVHLKNADAQKLAVTLRAAIAANVSDDRLMMQAMSAAAPDRANTRAVSATSPLETSGSPSTGGKIQADPTTNSLIITASEPEYRQLRAVIDRLDTPRAQVYVESLIVEVNASTMAKLGVQWQSPYDNGSRLGIVGTNFGTDANIQTLSAAIANKNIAAARLSQGLNLAALATFKNVPILGVVANFLQNTGDANILSTPNLITLDNEEARIMIGQNVPFVSGSYTNNNSANGSVNPFQTVTRQDVGITLRVKPQINANNMVKMKVYQEVSSIDNSSTASVYGPVTNKRTIESQVLVGNGQIIVLGGLLSDRYSNSKNKVPLLGDIPLLGKLFRNEKRDRQKNNLMVFLRPIIINDPASSFRLSLDRYELIRRSQINSQPARGIVHPYESVVLPPMSPNADRIIQPNTKPLLQQPLQQDTYIQQRTKPQKGKRVRLNQPRPNKQQPPANKQPSVKLEQRVQSLMRSENPSEKFSVRASSEPVYWWQQNNL